MFSPFIPDKEGVFLEEQEVLVFKENGYAVKDSNNNWNFVFVADRSRANPYTFHRKNEVISFVQKRDDMYCFDGGRDGVSHKVHESHIRKVIARRKIEISFHEV